MSRTVSLKLTTIANAEHVLTDVLSFKIVREYYTPYSTLKVEAVCPKEISQLIKKVELILDDTTIYSGLMDTLTLNRLPDFITMSISSKSFSVLLCQNQLEPGIKSSVSLNSLIEDFITIPEISHEDNSEVVNYIYVKSSSTLWDAVINLTHKLNSGHPYVCENNKIMVTQKQSPFTLNLTQSVLTSTGTGVDTTKMVSNIHMQDIEGNYSTYNLDNSDAIALNIVRHKHIDLDRQYLSSPQDALIHKINFSMRGYYYVYGTYEGYQGEDIDDYVTFYNYYKNNRISRLEITGVNGNVSTKVYAYTDNYLTYNMSDS